MSLKLVCILGTHTHIHKKILPFCVLGLKILKNIICNKHQIINLPRALMSLGPGLAIALSYIHALNLFTVVVNMCMEHFETNLHLYTIW